MLKNSFIILLISLTMTVNAYALKENSMPNILNLVTKTDPILREIMPDVVDFNDSSLAEIIEDMRYSIHPDQLKSRAAGMAANQWGIKKRIFIFAPLGSDTEGEVMINPSYLPHQNKMNAGYEGCFSIPLSVGLINRYDAIIATYFTQAGEKIERLLEGWEARVFQHETDHLNGRLYDGSLENYQGPEILERIIFQNKEELEVWLSKEREKREDK